MGWSDPCHNALKGHAQGNRRRNDTSPDELTKAIPALANGGAPAASVPFTAIVKRMLGPARHAMPPATRILTFAVLVSAHAQSADITGWQGLPWGSKKPIVVKALQTFHVHECRPAEPSCAGTPGTDELRIEAYRLNGIVYEVNLFFTPKSGLARVTMTSDDDRDAFQNALSELTGRYGKLGLQSGYDGDREITRTLWNWLTPHGKVSLAFECGEGANAVFTITYEARSGGKRLQNAKGPLLSST